MSKISFEVSARTARLIGQENFAQAEGAIVELVKNCYDADAHNCIVVFDVPFADVPNHPPKRLNIHQFEKFKNKELIKVSYTLDKKTSEYKLIDNIPAKEKQAIISYFQKFNSIYIIDNGTGMNDKIIRNHWMKIGTSNKRENFKSDDGRIRTGAKGIGRFALDRLGTISEMWTIPNEQENKGHYWKMDWSQFEIPNLPLSEIKADLLDKKNLDFKIILSDILKYKRLNKIIDENKFKSGTIIKISGLKDTWTEIELNKLFNNLEALIPPKELKIPFKVDLHYLQEEENLYGEVDTAFFDDYDYKVTATYNVENLKVNITFDRNELDTKLLSTSYKPIFDNVDEAYNLEKLEKKIYELEPKLVSEVLKWQFNEENKEIFKAIGSFDFTFYFMKNQTSRKFPYRDFNSEERKKILNRFGGVKIYRDKFRVRPYGENGDDWLKLGERAAISPAGPGQRVGQWRIRPNAIAGIVEISRIKNPLLKDKSDRGALVENRTFQIFKKIIVGIIHEFEYDRSKILHPFYLERKEFEKQKTEQKRERKAKSTVQKLLDAQEKSSNQDSNNEEQKRNYERIIEDAFKSFDNDDEKDAEIAQVRSLASLGLIVSSFAHELKKIRNNTHEIIDLENIYQKLYKHVEKDLTTTTQYQDGIDIIDLLKRDNERVKHWINYSLTAIKKDKRKREKLNFDSYFQSLKKSWHNTLIERNVKLEYCQLDNNKYNFRAFEMDMDTIFGNLITNSLDAFKGVVKRKKIILISYKIIDNNIRIIYEDNGKGISNVFQNKDDIFLPFETSKKDRHGNNLGTGLGMYLVKNVVKDNNGTVELIETTTGFKLQIEFPTRKN